MRKMNFYFLIVCLIFVRLIHANDIAPFFVPCKDGSLLEGYISPPPTPSSPVVMAIQGSSCESVFQWSVDLAEQLQAAGVGLIVIEKRGISRYGINQQQYHETNSLEQRLHDYTVILDNIPVVLPNWSGKLAFWGDSEGSVLAAHLGTVHLDTAAILMFGAGGGMEPKEEVRWVMQHYLEQNQASEKDISEYMVYLNNQMDLMIHDPSPNNHFLGNTYKWWSSFLTSHTHFLRPMELSIPLFYAHGILDERVPVLSADIFTEQFNESDILTYLRLEGYGHDLNMPNIQSEACVWLTSILSGAKYMNDHAMTMHPSLSSNNKTEIADYIFRRGKGEVTASTHGEKTKEGSKATASLEASVKNDAGTQVSVEGSASVSQDKQGNTKKEASGKASIKWNF
jgi:hypothetical protein